MRGGRVGFGDERAHFHPQRLGVAAFDSDRLAAEPDEIALRCGSTFGVGGSRAAQRTFRLADLPQ